MKTILTAVLITLIALVALHAARPYSNRPIQATDMIVVTDANGEEFLKRWSDATTFVEGDINHITNELTVLSLDVTGNASIGDTLIVGDARIDDIRTDCNFADSVYIAGNLTVDGLIYGLNSYAFAHLTTSGDTVFVNTDYETISAAFTNPFINDFTATDSGIVYTGAVARLFEIQASISYSTDKTTNAITHSFEINDTLCACTQSIFKTQVAGEYGVGSFVSIRSIDPGDRIELVVKSDEAGTTITYYQYTTTIQVVF